MAIGTADLPVIFQGSVGTLERWLDGHGYIHIGVGGSLLSQPSFASATELVASSDAVIHAFSAAAEKLAPGVELGIDAALHFDLPAICASGWIQSAGSVQGDVAIGLAARMREIVSSHALTSGTSIQYEPRTLRPRPDTQPVRLSEIAVAYVGAAGLDQWSSEHAEHDYQLKLERIKTGLGLKVSELASLVGVTREAIRQWNAGAGISPDRWGEIDRLYGLTTQLQRYFRPESVPGQVRRKIPPFDGMTALQMIAARRDSELMGRYRRLFESDAMR